MKKIICILLLMHVTLSLFSLSSISVSLQNADAQQTSEKIPSLSTLRVRDELLDQYFEDGIKIHFDKAITTIINQPVEDAYYRDTGEYIQTRLIATKLDARKETLYTIDFHPGYSLDPGFILYKNTPQGLEKVGVIFGLEITFPGDGFFYVTGHTNNTFNQRRKFTIRDDALVEIQQPFYYVGLETVAKEDFNIYADVGLTIPVAHVPKNTPITVVLNTDDYYLIKTPRDLLGWIKLHVGQQDTIIEGLYYFGD